MEGESDRGQKENNSSTPMLCQRKRKPPGSPPDDQEAEVSPKKALKLDDRDPDEISTKEKRNPHHMPDRQIEENRMLRQLDRSSISVEEEVVKGKKYVRKRLKYLLQAVMDQMEFYFSDSNLSKDRFLKKYIDQSPDGYVDLSIFGNFNKLQQLGKDGVSLKILAKAIAQSKVLQLNADKTRVKRTTPFKEISAEETDNRTVYVEYLPNHATHAWIQTTFAPCGKVMYISLPKYQSTGQIKGFAFVEFQSAEEADKACKMLNNPPLTKDGDKPGKFPKGNKTLDRLEKLVPIEIGQTSTETIHEEIQEEEPKDDVSRKKKKKKGKRKLGEDGENSQQGEEESQPRAKVPKLEDGTDAKEGKKKKKKKKRRKPGLSQEESLVKNEDEHLKEEKGVRDDTGPMTEPGAISQESKSKPLEPKNREISVKKKKKKKKKKNSTKKPEQQDEAPTQSSEEASKSGEPSNLTSGTPSDSNQPAVGTEKENEKCKGDQEVAKEGLGRRERKRLRQEEIRQKRLASEAAEKKFKEQQESSSQAGDVINPPQKESSGLGSSHPNTSRTGEVVEFTEVETQRRKSDGTELTSILKSKRPKTNKKVEFDPIPVTQEFVREKEIRKRRKAKKDKLNLRVISKKDWLNLKAEYLKQQKSHMTALKESLRELRNQESQNIEPQSQGPKHIDLEDVFGTKRLKPTMEVKMAHVEALKFTPNVIVQWKSSNEMHRDKIRTMFKDISGDSIAYIDAQEEAKTGYIRFKDEASAEQFAKLSRHSNSFSARVLPVEQQQTYWDKANADRRKKLGRKNQEKGSERIARKVFERNKVTFHEKPSRIVFSEDGSEEKTSAEQDK